jgi:anti-anti-sigma factor
MLHVAIQHAGMNTVVQCRGRMVLGADFQSLHVVDKVARRNVVITLKQVKSLDAYSIGQLLGLRRRLVSSGRSIVLWRPEKQILALLRLTGMLSVFAVECSGTISPAASRNKRLSFGCAVEPVDRIAMWIRYSWNLLVRALSRLRFRFSSEHKRRRSVNMATAHYEHRIEPRCNC